jgi:ATP-binding cassette subfamily A (ABC1) protein 3
MTLIPGSWVADIATQFEVPITTNEYSFSNFFNTLSKHGGFTEYTVEKATLESVIRELEDLDERHGSRGFRLC